ncbi:MAG: hypothetical protein ACK4NZ_01095 [Tsuneonella sp.]
MSVPDKPFLTSTKPGQKPKVFLFAVGARDRASSRLRVWDHIDWLKEQGFDVQVDSQIADGITGAGMGTYVRAIMGLPRWLAKCFWADVLFIQESLVLWPIAFMKNIGRERRLVFDFSDPIDSVGSGFKAAIRRRLFSLMVGRADAVMVENRAYFGRLDGAAKQLAHFYGPVNASRYGAARLRSEAEGTASEERPLRFVWTGSPGTFAFVAPLLHEIDRLAATRSVTVSLIGAPDVDLDLQHAAMERHSWREETEFDLVAAADFGLFRLPPGNAGLLRGAGKLFIYLAAGVVPIASARGISADLMAESGLGIPVVDDTDWSGALQRASAMSVTERAEASRRSRAFAANDLSYEAYRKRLVSLLGQACKGDGTSCSPSS